jgi:hypothetical protein
VVEIRNALIRERPGRTGDLIARGVIPAINQRDDVGVEYDYYFAA